MCRGMHDPSSNPSRSGDSPAGKSGAESGHDLVYNDRSMIEATRDQIVDAMQRRGYPQASVFAVRLAFEEAVSNAFRHGHASLDSEEPVDVTWRVDEWLVRISIEDRGPGFTPDSVPDPTEDERLDVPSGRGLMLIRAYMSSVAFNETGNRIEMVYDRPEGED